MPHFPGDRDKVTPRRSSQGGGARGDLESHWFNSADTDQALAVYLELHHVLGRGGGAERGQS